MGMCWSQRFPGSFFLASSDPALLMRYACEVTSIRMVFLIDQPSAIKRCASQSSSSGCEIPPDAVDHDARGEGIRCAGHRLSQLQPGWPGVGLKIQRLEVTTGNRRPGILRIAANQQGLILPSIV